jgi:hypothetical protein
MTSEIKLGRPRGYDRTALCFRCFVTFERYPGKQKNERTYCSRACYLEQLAEENLLKRVNQKGGLTPEERSKIRVKRLEHLAAKPQSNNGRTYEKRSGRHVHRVVMEEKLGRKLVQGEIVHHIDGDKRNNHPKNLMLFPSQAEHLNWHRKHDARYGGDVTHD